MVSGAGSQLEHQVESPVYLKQPHSGQYSYHAPLKPRTLTLPVGLAQRAHTRHWCNPLPLAQQHHDDQAAGACDDDQGQQVAQHDEQVFVAAVDYGTKSFTTLKEIWWAIVGGCCVIFRMALDVYDKNGETEQRGEHDTNPTHHPGWPDAVQPDWETDPFIGVPQLLVAEDANEDSEEDAADFTKHSQELEGATLPSARGGDGSLEDDNVIDVHNENFLQVGCGQSEEKELKGLHSGDLGLDDGKDEKYITHDSDARNEDS